MKCASEPFRQMVYHIRRNDVSHGHEFMSQVTKYAGRRDDTNQRPNPAEEILRQLNVSVREGVVTAVGPDAVYVAVANAEPMQEIAIVRDGLSTDILATLSDKLQLERGAVLQALYLPRSTFQRRVRAHEPLRREESERALALMKIIAEAERIYDESGTGPDFDVGAWVGRWIERRNPALGGHTPAELLDTSIGQQTVLGLISKMQSAAYA